MIPAGEGWLTLRMRGKWHVSTRGRLGRRRPRTLLLSTKQTIMIRSGTLRGASLRMYDVGEVVMMNQARFALAISFALACGVAFGQSTPAPQAGWITPGTVEFTPQRPPQVCSDPAIQARFFRICAYLGLSSPLQGGDQTLAGMGDEAAADIFEIVRTRPPLSAAETLTALDIVHKAFAIPRALTVEKRKPIVALRLMETLQLTAVDPAVKERIAAETAYLKAVPQILPPLRFIGPTMPQPPGTIVVN
jgi:hypothetical protein